MHYQHLTTTVTLTISLRVQKSSLAVLKKMQRDRSRSIFLISHRDELYGRVTNVLNVIKAKNTLLDRDLKRIKSLNRRLQTTIPSLPIMRKMRPPSNPHQCRCGARPCSLQFNGHWRRPWSTRRRARKTFRGRCRNCYDYWIDMWSICETDQIGRFRNDGTERRRALVQSDSIFLCASSSDHFLLRISNESFLVL